jgi:uroporphyrinogen decarboxylase
MVLNARGRVIRQINHQETDVIPYTIRFAEDVGEQAEAYGVEVSKRLDEYYGSPAWRTRIDNAIVRLATRDMGVDTARGSVYTDLYGSRWRVDRRPFHLEEPALKEPSLRGYSFPAVGEMMDEAWEKQTRQAIADAADHFVVVGFGFGLWERAWTLRGFDNALADAAGEPAFFEELLDQITEHQMDIIERLVRLPVDGVMFSDDWGYQRGLLLGPKRWRSLMKPRLARMYDRVHAAGKYTLSHCCGSVAQVMPDIIEAGLDVLESVQPEAEGMNPYELKRQFGCDITFWGGMGSQSLIPFGTPSEIRAEAARLCREMGRGGGYILSTAKPLQPETPTENAAAVVEAFLQQAGVAFP